MFDQQFNKYEKKLVKQQQITFYIFHFYMYPLTSVNFFRCSLQESAIFALLDQV